MITVSSQELDDMSVPVYYTYKDCKGEEHTELITQGYTYKFTQCGTEKSPCPVSSHYSIISGRFVRI